ncbi:MAG: two-component system response regulator [Bacteroidota bacterium]|jgi:CheY-like chemotaxis protein|nr:two-component system response regulator [Bacteroidota bacterium]
MFLANIQGKMKKDIKDLLIYSVDDDKDERFFIKEAFTDFVDAGQLRFFTNGVELIESLSEHTGPLPDFIIMDLNMPLMNGREALDIIKNNPVWKEIPVVIFSTSNYEKDIANCLSSGAMKYICKPASMMEYPKIFESLIKEITSEQ